MMGDRYMAVVLRGWGGLCMGDRFGESGDGEMEVEVEGKNGGD